MRKRDFSKPKNVKQTVKRLLGYVMQKKIQLVIVLVFLLISSLAGVAGTYMLKPVVNSLVPLIGTNPGVAQMSVFIKLLLLMCAIYLSGVVASYVANRLMVYISNGILNTVRRDMFDKMQDMPIGFFDTHTHGEVMSRYTNDVDTLRNAISQGATQLITSCVTVISTFIMMLVLSPLLTLVVLGMLVVITFVIKFIGGKSVMYFKKQQKALGKTNGYIEEMIEGQKVVKVFCHEDSVKESFAVLNDELKDAAGKANMLGNMMMPITANLAYVNYALVAVCCGFRVIAGNFDIGSAASFLQYSRSFFQPINQMTNITNTLLSSLAGAERIFALIDTPPETDEGSVTCVYAKKDDNGKIIETASSDKDSHRYWKVPAEGGGYDYVLVNGAVKVNDVSFGYTPEKQVLKNISFYAKPDQKIALVGSTGAGKTTITNLINRFYDVSEGCITYDGIDIRNIKKADLRSTLAMVLQDTHLFTGTVKENIRFGRLDATDDEVVAAAKLANAHFFISHLPNGYDTLLTSDGANLSQGQRQLLAIARAAVANPEVLILDEATSSIDTRTESHIEKGMDTLMQNRTVFVIAHRLSTVRNANAIMVMEGGEIIERGDHDELLEQQGRYYELYTGKSELS